MVTKNFAEFTVDTSVKAVREASTTAQIIKLQHVTAVNRERVKAAMRLIASEHGVEFGKLLDFTGHIGAEFAAGGKVVLQARVMTYGTSPMSYFIVPNVAPKSGKFETICAASEVDGRTPTNTFKTGDVAISWANGKPSCEIMGVVNNSHRGKDSFMA